MASGLPGKRISELPAVVESEITTQDTFITSVSSVSGWDTKKISLFHLADFIQETVNRKNTIEISPSQINSSIPVNISSTDYNFKLNTEIGKPVVFRLLFDTFNIGVSGVQTSSSEGTLVWDHQAAYHTSPIVLNVGESQLLKYQLSSGGYASFRLSFDSFNSINFSIKGESAGDNIPVVVDETQDSNKQYTFITGVIRQDTSTSTYFIETGGLDDPGPKYEIINLNAFANIGDNVGKAVQLAGFVAAGKTGVLLDTELISIDTTVEIRIFDTLEIANNNSQGEMSVSNTSPDNIYITFDDIITSYKVGIEYPDPNNSDEILTRSFVTNDVTFEIKMYEADTLIVTPLPDGEEITISDLDEEPREYVYGDKKYTFECGDDFFIIEYKDVYVFPESITRVTADGSQIAASFGSKIAGVPVNSDTIVQDIAFTSSISKIKTDTKSYEWAGSGDKPIVNIYKVTVENSGAYYFTSDKTKPDVINNSTDEYTYLGIFTRDNINAGSCSFYVNGTAATLNGVQLDAETTYYLVQGYRLQDDTVNNVSVNIVCKDSPFTQGSSLTISPPASELKVTSPTPKKPTLSPNKIITEASPQPAPSSQKQVTAPTPITTPKIINVESSDIGYKINLGDGYKRHPLLELEKDKNYTFILRDELNGLSFSTSHDGTHNNGKDIFVMCTIIDSDLRSYILYTDDDLPDTIYYYSKNEPNQGGKIIIR